MMRASVKKDNRCDELQEEVMRLNRQLTAFQVLCARKGIDFEHILEIKSSKDSVSNRQKRQIMEHLGTIWSLLEQNAKRFGRDTVFLRQCPKIADKLSDGYQVLL